MSANMNTMMCWTTRMTWLCSSEDPKLPTNTKVKTRCHTALEDPQDSMTMSKLLTTQRHPQKHGWGILASETCAQKKLKGKEYRTEELRDGQNRTSVKNEVPGINDASRMQWGKNTKTCNISTRNEDRRLQHDWPDKAISVPDVTNAKRSWSRIGFRKIWTGLWTEQDNDIDFITIHTKDKVGNGEPCIAAKHWLCFRSQKGLTAVECIYEVDEYIRRMTSTWVDEADECQATREQRREQSGEAFVLFILRILDHEGWLLMWRKPAPVCVMWVNDWTDHPGQTQEMMPCISGRMQEGNTCPQMPCIEDGIQEGGRCSIFISKQEGNSCQHTLGRRKWDVLLMFLLLWLSTSA